MRGTLLTSCLLVFVACAPEAERSEADATASARPNSVERESGSEHTAGSAENTQLADDVEIAEGSIPIQFRGVWSGLHGDCEEWGDMRMVVAARSIQFYETDSEVQSVTINSSDEVMIDLAMSGFGEEWESRIVLRLQPDDTLLVLPDPESGIMLRPARRKRCAE